MLQALILRKLDSLEKELGESIEYMRYVAKSSKRLLFKFMKFGAFAQHRKAMPKTPYFVACAVAAREEDCGPCVQILMNMARKEGVPAAPLQAVLDRRPEDLPDELADVYRFAEAVVAATWDEGEYRERIRERYGDEGLIELAYGIASSRVFPTVKRALGYAQSCSRVVVHV